MVLLILSAKIGLDGHTCTCFGHHGPVLSGHYFCHHLDISAKVYHT